MRSAFLFIHTNKLNDSGFQTYVLFFNLYILERLRQEGLFVGGVNFDQDQEVYIFILYFCILNIN